MLSVDLSTGLLELPAHRVVDQVTRETGSLTLVCLLLLHPPDQDDLQHDDTPENAPDRQNSFERIDLNNNSSVMDFTNKSGKGTYVLWSKLGIEDVGSDDVADGVASVERSVVDGLLGLSGAVATLSLIHI